MIVAIIQARMTSSRLKGKTLLPFGQTTVLGFMIKRISQAQSVEKVVVATSENSDDDEIEQACKTLGIDVFRGSHGDVLKRFYDAATYYGASVVVRLTADDPFKTASVIEFCINDLLNSELDYCSNTIDITYPEGLDVEVFTFGALKKAHFTATSQIDREHVTPFIWRNAGNQFSIGQVTTNPNLSEWRLTIDYQHDYEALCALVSLVSENCSYDELVRAVVKNNLESIMRPTIQRNEAFNANKN